MTEGTQTKKQNLDLALIGNSCAAAFVDQNARIVWWCYPHFDSDPVFSRLLAGDEEKGFCDVTLANLVQTESQYVRNTAIVETILTDANGGKVRISDFAPNFERFERVYRPPQIIRRVEPIAGLPRVTIRVRPTHGYGKPTTNFVVGSNHIRYLDGGQVLRLTSDAPLSYIVNEVSFPLSRPVNLIFRPGRPFSQRYRHDFARIPRPHPRLLARLGALSRARLRVASGGRARGDHAQALQLR